MSTNDLPEVVGGLQSITRLTKAPACRKSGLNMKKAAASEALGLTVEQLMGEAGL